MLAPAPDGYAIMARRIGTACAVALLLVAAHAPAQDSGLPSFAIEDQAREPFGIFDNLHYIGADFVSSYLVTTSDGLVVVDALFEGYGDYLLGNIRALGFDPNDVRYVLVTHSHPDHYGAAAEVAAATGAVVGMAAADWPVVAEAQGAAAPERGLVIDDGDTLTVGDTRFRFYVTPGHTPGVLSIRFPVYDGEQKHDAFSFGGAGLNTVTTPQAARDFVASLERVLAIEGLDVNVPNHPFMNDTFALAERLAAREPADPHPFVAPDALYGWLESILPQARERLRELED